MTPSLRTFWIHRLYLAPILTNNSKWPLNVSLKKKFTVLTSDLKNVNISICRLFLHLHSNLLAFPALPLSLLLSCPCPTKTAVLISVLPQSLPASAAAIFLLQLTVLKFYFLGNFISGFLPFCSIPAVVGQVSAKPHCITQTHHGCTAAGTACSDRERPPHMHTMSCPPDKMCLLIFLQTCLCWHTATLLLSFHSKVLQTQASPQAGRTITSVLS